MKSVKQFLHSFAANGKSPDRLKISTGRWHDYRSRRATRHFGLNRRRIFQPRIAAYRKLPTSGWPLTPVVSRFL
ncbi:hypothetical protein MRX96_027690 [Rhipicephalus microplus]